jgi:hypothetical protein
MIKISKILFILTLIVSMFYGCDQVNEEDEAPASAAEMVKGTWTISSMNMFGVDIPGDGSTLTFGDCIDGVCTGQDYEATDGTTGTFTYELTDNDTKIVIVDEDPSGGNYNTTWDILDLESKSLRMTGDFSIFGSMLVEMTK